MIRSKRSRIMLLVPATLIAVSVTYSLLNPIWKGTTLESSPLKDTILVGIDNSVEVLLKYGAIPGSGYRVQFDNSNNDAFIEKTRQLKYIVNCSEKSLNKTIHADVYFNDKLFLSKDFIVSAITPSISNRIAKNK